MEMEMEVVDSAGLELSGGLELRASDAVAERLVAAVEALEAAVERLAGVSVAAASGARKTASVGSLVAKEGPSHESGGAGLDAALSSLSVEQRIAVKAGLMRAGLV